MVLNLYYTFAFAVVATVSFGIMLQSPKKYLLVQGVIGAIGWTMYIALRQEYDFSSFYANFIATLCLSFASEASARIFKQPATIFIIPGIIPLVPGLPMYQGMSKIIANFYEEGMNILITAGTDAGAIALGVMMMTSIFRFLKMTVEKDHLFYILSTSAKKRE